MWGLREKFGLARWLGFESIYLVNSLGAQINPQNTQKISCWTALPNSPE